MIVIPLMLLLLLRKSSKIRPPMPVVLRLLEQCLTTARRITQSLT
nr:MAG TPA: hypothetical protein [Caudoviricetes sp.]